MEPKEFTQTLEVKLNDEEIAEHSAKAAEKAGKRNEHLGEANRLKSLSKNEKDDAESLDREINRHLLCVRKKTEIRDVDCETAYDASRRQMVTHRLDTDKEISRRGLLDSEKQQVLELEGTQEGMAENEITKEEEETADQAAPPETKDRKEPPHRRGLRPPPTYDDGQDDSA